MSLGLFVFFFSFHKNVEDKIIHCGFKNCLVKLVNFIYAKYSKEIGEPLDLVTNTFSDSIQDRNY